MSDTYEQLAEAIREHSSMDNDQIREAGKYSADAGWPGFTYTVDGADFYRANAEHIDELLADMADSMGLDNVAALIATFTRADMADTRDSRDCLLAWFALEEVGRWLADQDDEGE
jgi:hypothetical protein